MHPVKISALSPKLHIKEKYRKFESFMEDLIYKIALTLIPGIGNINGKNLIAYCGGVEAVFLERKHAMLRIPGIGEQTVNAILNHRLYDRAEAELGFMEKYKIKPLFYLDQDYPSRLKHCNDGPLLLYFKGTSDLNNPKVVAFVGTRKATEYGREMCWKIMDGLRDQDILIISGLAYGIDTWSHKAALDNKLETIGVLGHGLDRIYPYSNRSLAEKMIHSGGLITEFTSMTKPDRENFPMRNRIIAGMSDAVVVVEAGLQGGALITADLANSYNRDVFAVPGRIGDPHSEGCNNLIKTNRAALIQSADDIRYLLNWDQSTVMQSSSQRQLFIQMSNDEEAIVELLRNDGEQTIDILMIKLGLLPSQAATALLRLEFEGIIRCLPGKVYRLL
jgi:DNA processing protein